MLKNTLPKAMCLVFMGALLLLPASSAQQAEPVDQPADEQKPIIAPPAPVPTQIVTAKRVFISNPGLEFDSRNEFKYAGGADRAYNEFYSVLRSSGRYQLMASPADADLVLEIHFNLVLNGERTPHLRLLLLDPKTNVLLWGFLERVDTAGGFGWKDRTERKFNLAVANLGDDLRKLTSPSVGMPARPKQ